VLSTDQKGNIAETAIVHAAVKLGIDVYRAVVEGGRYDLILDLKPGLLRVQCKWAARHGEVVLVRSYSSRRSVGGKVITRLYMDDEADAFAAYCADLDRCFLLPAELWARRRTLHLRIEPTRNNQAKGCLMAVDYIW